MTPERLAELRELARRDHTKGCDMRCAACSCGYENGLEAAVPLMLDHIDAQAATIARMREALQVIVDDYQASPKHHPNDILIPIASFGLACAALTGAAS